MGKEAEDLSRHDKWLCMMYPRLALLREFLREDGLIFISLDDNEAASFKCVLDELFGRRNFVQQIVWKNKYGPGAMTRGFGNIHEYIFCYSRQPLKSIEAHLSPDQAAEYKKKDEHFAIRGGYITQPLATKSKDDRENLVYPIHYKGEEIWPDKQWIWEEGRMKAAIERNGVVFKKSKDGKWSVRFKQYLRDENGAMRMAKPISIMDGPFNQDGTGEIEAIFGEKVFSNPKPSELIRYLISMVVNDCDDKGAIVMDSFAGSGTTGHAVLAANAADGGSRRFICIEMDPTIAQDITRVRLQRVVEGYHPGGDKKKEKVPGLGGGGGGFQFVRLGPTMFNANGTLRDDGTDKVTFADLAAHIFFSQTGQPLAKVPTGKKGPLVGTFNNTAFFLLYNGVLGDKRPAGGNVLTRATLDLICEATPDIGGVKGMPMARVVFGEACILAESTLRAHGVTFYQLPYRVDGFPAGGSYEAPARRAPAESLAGAAAEGGK